MRARNICMVHAIACAAFGVVSACTGDDVVLGPDAGPPKTDATIDQTAPDAGADVDATMLGPRLLMTNFGTSGELATFDTQQGAVAGRVAFPGYGVVERSGSDTFLLETGSDVVAKLDPSSLASVTASWSVAGADVIDGGQSYADPVQVVEVATNKAYVLRYNRNQIAIVDPSQAADAGAPTGTIDLSSLVQAGDEDGAVDMTGAVYDVSRQRVYVLLGNVDLTAYGPAPDYPLLCVGTKMTLIAIDATNDTLVDLGGTGPGGGVELLGYDPQAAYYGGFTLDVSNDRVLVVSFGCSPTSGDGGVGATQQRIVEAVDLKTNTTTQLLDANGQDYPNVFRLIDATHAIIQFGFAPYLTTYEWNPTETSLGPALVTAPDVFDYDPVNLRILGPQSTLADDGGAGPTNVIAVTVLGAGGVPLPDGGVAVLGQNPFLQSGGYLGNALYAP